MAAADQSDVSPRACYPWPSGNRSAMPLTKVDDGVFGELDDYRQVVFFAA
jgi:hypothetical protein